MSYINSNTLNIKAIEYQNLNEYYVKGYFKFQDQKGDIAVAMREDCVIKKEEFSGDETFQIKKDDFIEILERDFAKDNTGWAINYLKDLSPNASAANVLYTKTLAGFSIIFIALLCLFVNFFSVLNNAAYLIQNILKTILFNRSLVESE